MKQILIIAISIILTQPIIAQEKGILFEQASNWKEITEKAKKENKYIFVDCYATWCVPCRYMSQNIFPLPEVAGYFNDHFISVKIQMDQTKADPPEIKQWYRDAKVMEKKYSINAYPTYLFFTPAGEVVHRVIGTTKTGKDFIGKAGDAFEPGRQYYTMIQQYKKHKNDSAFLRNAIGVALTSSDQLTASAIGNSYIGCLKDPYSKDNLTVIRQVTISSKDKGFKMFLNHPDKVDAVLSNGFSTATVSNIAYEEEIKPYFESDKLTPDWRALEKKIRTKYPVVTSQYIAFYQPVYYRVKKKFPEYEKVVLDYMNQYGDQLGDYEINGHAWDVFSFSDNKELLQEAIKWSKRALDLVPKDPGSNYVNYLDTYANLQYKLGNKEEALKYERLVVETAKKDNKEKIVQICSVTLSKMEKGEKTWE